MSASVKALVQVELDGQVYQPGEWIILPDAQQSRARSLVAYGLAVEAPAAPVRSSRRKKTS